MSVVLLKAALGYLAGATVKDAVVRPRYLGRLARSYCDRANKPLLYIHDNGVLHHLVGPAVQADAYASRWYPLACPDKSFGAIFAVGVLESCKRPDLAMREWERVADKVFAVVPSWWSPLAWAPWSKWYIDPECTQAQPVWTMSGRVYLLGMSDKRYRRASWSNPQSSPMSTSPPAPNQSTNPPPPVESQSVRAEDQLGGSSSSAAALVVISSRKSETS